MKTIMVYKDGLPDTPDSELFEVDMDRENMILSQITLGVLKNKVIQTYKIPLENIVECGFVTEKEVISADKSVVGRGLVGGFLFGPAGLVLGGMSGIGSKKKEKTIGLFVITYLSPRSPGELKSFVLDTGWNNRDLHNINFAKEARKKVEKVGKSELVTAFLASNEVETGVNSDGSITL